MWCVARGGWGGDKRFLDVSKFVDELMCPQGAKLKLKWFVRCAGRGGG